VRLAPARSDAGCCSMLLQSLQPGTAEGGCRHRRQAWGVPTAKCDPLQLLTSLGIKIRDSAGRLRKKEAHLLL